MPRIVALDIGDATIGIAASDELGITANPVRTLRRGKSVKEDLRALEEALVDLDAAVVVVGLPLSIDGGEGAQATKVRAFHKRLARRLRIPVVLWDESLSTAEAESALIEMDVSRAKRRKVIDKMAAAHILQGYLDSGEWKAESGGQRAES